MPDFDEFVEKHVNILKAILIQEILSKTPKRWPKDEEDKIEKTIEIAIDAAKKHNARRIREGGGAFEEAGIIARVMAIFLWLVITMLTKTAGQWCIHANNF